MHNVNKGLEQSALVMWSRRRSSIRTSTHTYGPIYRFCSQRARSYH